MKTRLQAHRGVSTEYPENTLAAFKAAFDEGYDIIELDMKYTADGQCVALHDNTVNRTGRAPDGGLLPENTGISSVAFETARGWDFGVWKGEKFKGERLPSLDEVIFFASARDISLKFDNVWEKYTETQRDGFLAALKGSGLGGRLGITCRVPDTLRTAAEALPDAELHWDGDTDAETLDAVSAVASGHRLTVWLCADNGKSAWYKGERANKALTERIRSRGAEVGIWILSEEAELDDAVGNLHADAIETTGSIKPYMLEKFR